MDPGLRCESGVGCNLHSHLVSSNARTISRIECRHGVLGWSFNSLAVLQQASDHGANLLYEGMRKGENMAYVVIFSLFI